MDLSEFQRRAVAHAAHATGAGRQAVQTLANVKAKAPRRLRRGEVRTRRADRRRETARRHGAQEEGLRVEAPRIWRPRQIRRSQAAREIRVERLAAIAKGEVPLTGSMGDSP